MYLNQESGSCVCPFEDIWRWNTISFCGIAVGQLVIGPLSDKYGRKSPLILSLMVFSVSTLGCLYAPDIYWFIFFRLIQGLAGAGGLVISKSIATDLYEGKELTRFFSMLSSVQGIAPICAPVLGGFLLGVTSWKGIFWILFAIGLLLLVTLFFFKESLPRAARREGGVWVAFRRYVPVLGHGRFMCYVLVQAFAMGVMFTYIAASPFIFSESLWSVSGSLQSVFWCQRCGGHVRQSDCIVFPWSYAGHAYRCSWFWIAQSVGGCGAGFRCFGDDC